jgi:hypothetical protein
VEEIADMLLYIIRLIRSSYLPAITKNLKQLKKDLLHSSFKEGNLLFLMSETKNELEHHSKYRIPVSPVISRKFQ